MEEARIIINRLRTRIAGILAEHVHIEGTLDKLTSERDVLLQEKSALEHKVVELERRIRVLEFSKGVTSLSGGTKSARDRVNRLLREIDKCIALMNK